MKDMIFKIGLMICVLGPIATISGFVNAAGFDLKFTLGCMGGVIYAELKGYFKTK